MHLHVNTFITIYIQDNMYKICFLFFPACSSRWCLLDLNKLDTLLESVDCPHCQSQQSLRASTSDAKRMGFALCLELSCRKCGTNFGNTYSSPALPSAKKPSPFLVNDLMTLIFNRLGLGHTAMVEFCGVLGMPAMHLKTFQKKEFNIVRKTLEATENVLERSVAIVRAMHCELNPDFPSDQPVPITVSFDGTWQKRGHMSMHGVAAVIEVVTGLVVDFVVLSTYCHSCSLKRAECRDDAAAFDAWYVDHKEDCSINYHGSSNAMEVEAAKRLWSRSVARHNLMYTGMLGDGDSKAHKAVVVMEPYGPDVEIVKEECLNHAHKRMGTALLKLSKEKKLGGRGEGRLTKEKALRMQHYYRFALNAGVGDADDMRNRVWATLFHCLSTDEDPHHSRCPSGTKSWCFFQRALADDEDPPPHATNVKHPLSTEVAEAMKPIYERMSDPNLLKRMLKGKTQNTNECLHSVIWSRCSKTVFVGHRRLRCAVARAVGSFNAGASHLTEVMELLAVETNELTQAFTEKVDVLRIAKAERANKSCVKSRRKGRADARKLQRAVNEDTEGPTYQPGGFT